MGSLALLSAVAPIVAVLWYFAARDRFRLGGELLLLAVSLGATVAIPVAGVALAIDLLVDRIDSLYAHALASAFLLAAIPEELAKLAVLLFFVLRHQDVSRPVDAFLLAVFVALGFAGIENIMYVLDSPDWGGVALARAATAVPSHAADGAAMGYFAARMATEHGRRISNLTMMAIGPILLHGLYDFPLFAMENASIAGRGRDAVQDWALSGLLSAVVLVGAILLLVAARRVLRQDRESTEGVPRAAGGRWRRLLGWAGLVFGAFYLLAGLLILAVAASRVPLFGLAAFDGGGVAPRISAFAWFPLLLGGAMIRTGWRTARAKPDAALVATSRRACSKATAAVIGSAADRS